MILTIATIGVGLFILGFIAYAIKDVNKNNEGGNKKCH